MYHAGEMHCHGGGCDGGGGAEGHGSLQWMGDGERVVISYARVGEGGVSGGRRTSDDEMDGSLSDGYGQMYSSARNSGLQRSSTMSGELARFSTKPVRTVASSVDLSFPVQIAFERAMRRRTVGKKPTSNCT